ncbi:MAG: hypothetical protein JF616_13695 [Fibrobacteres bacterium]|jgi:hypothetical protein|nr:hypothetical protein [Fibrobacterota bacterium]
MKPYLSLIALVILSQSHPIRAQAVDSNYQEQIRRVNSQIHAGKTLMWTGTALLPVSALALVPVLYDGAFGITGADAGFSVFFAVLGLGLIHIGIPVYGEGASNLENAAGGEASARSVSAESGWSHYRRSWGFMAAGSLVLVADFPVAFLAAFEHRENALTYSADALGLTGLSLLGIGALEQHYSLYRFIKASDHARDSLKAHPQVSLLPYLRLGKQAPGAGMRLTCSF